MKKKDILLSALIIVLAGAAFFITRYHSVKNTVAVFFPEEIKPDLTGYPFIGNKNGRITIIELSDFECAYSKKMQLTLDTLHKNLGGLIKHYFKPRPIYDDKIRQLRSRAVLAAKQQGKYWEMKHELFSIDIDQENRGNKKFLKEAIFEKARDIGLDINKFRKDLNSRAIRKELRSITDEADTYGITTVPTLFINGTMIVGYHSFNYYLDVIVQKLNQKQQTSIERGTSHEDKGVL